MSSVESPVSVDASSITAPQSTAMPAPGALHGVMAEFSSMSDLIAAIHAAREHGYRHMDAYSPFPSHEISHALHLAPSPLPYMVLAGGIIGMLAGYFLQYYAAVIDYPTNIGGRPLHSWPFFVPITFECTIAGAALTAVFGMLALNRLPTPYHPVFNHPTFALASRDAFFLCIEATDPKFDRDLCIAFFQETGGRHVADLEA
jgi:hypothetical protein